MKDFGKEIIPGLLGKMRLCSYIFEGYWEDIGTVGAFFETNLALAQPLPPFNFFDTSGKIYTHSRQLPPAKLNRCIIDHVVIGEGSIITQCSIKRCVIGVRSYINEGTTFEDVVMMGADYYEMPNVQQENQAKGLPSLGVGRNCHIRRAIIDKNARIGDNCSLSPEGKPDGAYAGGSVIIRDGVLVVPKGQVIQPGTVV
jgi:glucose-1-phosphate adenylyltransferase